MMKRFFFVLFGLAVALMSWEGQIASANIHSNGPIPQESIRLRILANSDSMEDQWLKREVRDAIIAEMNKWIKEIHSYDQARLLVADHMNEIKKIVDKTIAERGYSYPAEVYFGRVEFPTKQYGSYIYPAGDYEALRVRIGKAEGQNWWCVLFPPLCFIDLSNGDGIAKRDDAVDNLSGTVEEEIQVVESAQSTMGNRDLQPQLNRENSDNYNEKETGIVREEMAENIDTAAIVPNDQASKVEVRSFIWDKLRSWF
ncbi:stage II sporulation protein R [Brevibacillus laterosporus]|uniref:stage II sporulation protein R n=1 Tax=Brevibacillus laterosporus TaxID=1465 RepID=UPI00037A39EF|nr:stage II sporulation protein R [Brevibacillus laterosporus]ATO49191.1 stage II sporulation protein R [Brevibacillus laterosporus DSM 25]MED2003507.1 stage II sporulation protein R [Brevibacillus laterosporus]